MGLWRLKKSSTCCPLFKSEITFVEDPLQRWPGERMATKINENMIPIDQLIVLLPNLKWKVDSFTVWATREAPNSIYIFMEK